MKNEMAHIKYIRRDMYTFCALLWFVREKFNLDAGLWDMPGILFICFLFCYVFVFVVMRHIHIKFGIKLHIYAESEVYPC